MNTKQKADLKVNDEISLCPECHCMTKTIHIKICGKCREIKNKEAIK